MEHFFAPLITHPDESYSRQIDKMVADQEKPYGYNVPPPPAGHDNHEAHEKNFFKARKQK